MIYAIPSLWFHTSLSPAAPSPRSRWDAKLPTATPEFVLDDAPATFPSVLPVGIDSYSHILDEDIQLKKLHSCIPSEDYSMQAQVKPVLFADFASSTPIQSAPRIDNLLLLTSSQSARADVGVELALLVPDESSEMHIPVRLNVEIVENITLLPSVATVLPVGPHLETQLC